MNIHVVGYPKSGTTWLTRSLADALDSPCGGISRSAKPVAVEGTGRSGAHYVGQGHPVPVRSGPDAPTSPSHLLINLDNLGGKIILMTRDPRDVVVSARHHWGMESLDMAIDCVLNGVWPLPHGGGWDKFYRAWLETGDLIKVDYSEMIANPELTLSRLLGELGLKLTIDLSVVTKRQEINARRKSTSDSLPYGKEWQLRFLRKGIVGDWKNHLSPDESERIITATKDVFEEFGYER